MDASGPRDGAADPATGMTTGHLARRLGVSPTTVRSWGRRYGLGPAAREQGHHRRWSPDDVAMMQEMCRLTASGVPPAEAARAALRRAGRPVPVSAPDPDAPGPEAPARGRQAGSGVALGDARRECRGLARAALRLDGAAVQDQVARSIATYGLATAWEEVLAPTLRAVGRKWAATGDGYVEVEHLLSWHTSAALRHAYVRASAPESGVDSPPVVLSCLPGEQHTLPLEVLGAVLAEQGVPLLMLGGSVPADALVATVRRIGASSVVLWSQSGATADVALARHVAGLRWGMSGARTAVSVFLCGPGWEHAADSTAALSRPATLREAVARVRAAGPSQNRHPDAGGAAGGRATGP